MSKTLSAESDILEGLSDVQKELVHRWLNELSLTTKDLATWNAVRLKFLKSTAYKVPVVTRVDEVCRDLFELKQFAQRLVALLDTVALETVAKKTQGAFSAERIGHWRDAIASIKLPFRFDTGAPQAELYRLAERSSEGRGGGGEDADISSCRRRRTLESAVRRNTAASAAAGSSGRSSTGNVVEKTILPDETPAVAAPSSSSSGGLSSTTVTTNTRPTKSCNADVTGSTPPSSSSSHSVRVIANSGTPAISTEPTDHHPPITTAVSAGAGASCTVAAVDPTVCPPSVNNTTTTTSSATALESAAPSISEANGSGNNVGADIGPNVTPLRHASVTQAGDKVASSSSDSSYDEGSHHEGSHCERPQHVDESNNKNNSDSISNSSNNSGSSYNSNNSNNSGSNSGIIEHCGAVGSDYERNDATETGYRDEPPEAASGIVECSSVSRGETDAAAQRMMRLRDDDDGGERCPRQSEQVPHRNRALDEKPETASKTARNAASTAETDAVVKGEGEPMKPSREGRAARTEPFEANPYTPAFSMHDYDLPVVEISALLRKYLLQFRVEPIEFVWWMNLRRELPKMSKQIKRILPKADEYLTFISNILSSIPEGTSKESIPSIAAAYNVQAHSLEKWMHYRKLFDQDKTAVKLALFGERALASETAADSRIHQLEKVSRYKPPPKRRRLPLPTVGGIHADPELVERVMSFYMLSPSVLDQLPLPENAPVLASTELASLLPVQRLLYDLESIIIKKCEVSQFQEMFPEDAARVCFGPALLNSSGHLRSLYQLPLSDVLSTVNTDNSRLRSKEVVIPAYFDTVYDGAQPVLPTGVTCALVNAIHTGSTSRERERKKTLAKIKRLLMMYNTIPDSFEAPVETQQQPNVGIHESVALASKSSNINPSHMSGSVTKKPSLAGPHEIRIKDEPMESSYDD